MVKAKATPTPDESRPPEGGYDPKKHGTWAQWVAPGVSLLGAVITLASLHHTIQYHDEADQSKVSDEHIKLLVDDRVGPKLDQINEHLNQLGEKLSHLEGMVIKYTQSQDKLQSTVDQQIALAKMTDPKRFDRAVAVIRTEVERARYTKQPLPIADYRAALRDLPDTANGYWKAVAAIINYQSFLDQKVGLAPDPRSVAHRCVGLTAGVGDYNMFSGPIQNCIVDIDTAHVLLKNVTIRNSVIRYHGGPITVQNAVLINCYFEVDLTNPPNPSQTELLRAILNSPEQKTVALQNIKPAPG